MEEKKSQDSAAKKSFFKGVKAEFKKVIWPDRSSVMKQTVAVVFFTVFLGVFIAIIDAVAGFGIGFIL